MRDPTGGAYDLALHGEGFFTVRDTQGKIVTERYWKEDRPWPFHVPRMGAADVPRPCAFQAATM